MLLWVRVSASILIGYFFCPLYLIVKVFKACYNTDWTYIHDVIYEVLSPGFRFKTSVMFRHPLISYEHTLDGTIIKFLTYCFRYHLVGIAHLDVQVVNI